MDLSKHSHDPEALDALRDVNRELFVVCSANVPETVAAEAEAARGHVLAAIHFLDPLPDDSKRPLHERPLADYKAAVAASEPTAREVTGPMEDELDRRDISRN